MNSQAAQFKQATYTHNPTTSMPAATLLLFGRKKKEANPTSTATQEAPQSKPKKHTGQKVAKAEIAEDKLRFYAEKGLFKKRWVVVKEFPVAEVSEAESSENWLRLKYNGVDYTFLLKRKNDSFNELFVQLQAALEEFKKVRERKERAEVRKKDLLAALNTVFPTIDASFDVLMGLHKKRVDWTQIEGYTQTWGLPLNFQAQTLPPLDLDYSKVAAAIKAQVAKETAKETLNLLKTVHAYFTALKPEDDIAEAAPNFEQTKAIILAYYTLNDLFLARVVNDPDIAPAVAYLEANLKSLSDATLFKVDMSELMATVDAAGTLGNAGDARTLFSEKLKQF
jgi:hypothetical protein